MGGGSASGWEQATQRARASGTTRAAWAVCTPNARRLLARTPHPDPSPLAGRGLYGSRRSVGGGVSGIRYLFDFGVVALVLVGVAGVAGVAGGVVADVVAVVLVLPVSSGAGCPSSSCTWYITRRFIAL